MYMLQWEKNKLFVRLPFFYPHIIQIFKKYQKKGIFVIY